MSAAGAGGRLAAAVGAVVLVAVGAGLYLAGSPAEARLHRMDERRVNDLERARAMIDGYRARSGHLPIVLDSVVAPGDEPLVDPATRLPYEYSVTSDSTYELCADFARDVGAGGTTRASGWWWHRSGRQCFPVTASQAR